jgi:NAD+ synthase (glutamine-hydrolysing)
VEVYNELKHEGLAADHLLGAYINKFFRLWSHNQWKRERIAPSFHLDEFNIDPKTWCRFPILSGGFKNELEMLSKVTTGK